MQPAVVAFDGRFMKAADLFTATFAAALQAASIVEAPSLGTNTIFKLPRSAELIALHT